jgi:hypothetical protein
MTNAEIRAKAKDKADELDNMTAYMTETERTEVYEYVSALLSTAFDIHDRNSPTSEGLLVFMASFHACAFGEAVEA